MSQLIDLTNYTLPNAWMTNTNITDNEMNINPIFSLFKLNENITNNIKHHTEISNISTLNSERNNISYLVSAMLSNLTVLKYNSVYRVGNLLYQWGPNWKWDIIKIRNNNQKRWSDTILYKYFNLADIKMIRFSPNKFDVELLKHIINEYIIEYNISSSELPSNDEIVIHIRTGDVIHYHDFIPLINGTISKYQNINKISFVTALHFGDDRRRNKYLYTKQQEMANRKFLREMFVKIINTFPNLSYKLISNRNTDKDMVYLSKAKYLIRDIGTFDHVITELNDNIIINKFNDTIFFRP